MGIIGATKRKATTYYQNDQNFPLSHARFLLGRLAVPPLVIVALRLDTAYIKARIETKSTRNPRLEINTRAEPNSGQSGGHPAQANRKDIHSVRTPIPTPKAEISSSLVGVNLSSYPLSVDYVGLASNRKNENRQRRHKRNHAEAKHEKTVIDYCGCIAICDSLCRDAERGDIPSPTHKGRHRADQKSNHGCNPESIHLLAFCDSFRRKSRLAGKSTVTLVGTAQKIGSAWVTTR